jgi:hypothetical protein
MSDRAERLQAYIDTVKDTSCEWGRDDCSMFAGRWIEIEREIVLSLPRYRSEDEARAMIARDGGLLAIWDRIARVAGILETGAPDMGDVGLIETARFGPVGVIFAGSGMAFWRATQGLTVLQPRARTILRAWSV